MRVSNVTVRKRLILYLYQVYLFSLYRYSSWICAVFLGNMLTDRAKDSWSRNITFEPEREDFRPKWCGTCHE